MCKSRVRRKGRNDVSLTRKQTCISFIKGRRPAGKGRPGLICPWVFRTPVFSMRLVDPRISSSAHAPQTRGQARLPEAGAER